MLTTTITVLYIEDHVLVREAIARFIDIAPDMKVVATASTGGEAVPLFLLHRPEITLVDLRLPDMSGIDVIRAIRREQADAKVVVLTMHCSDEDIHQAYDAGAASYLLKTGVADELIRTLRAVCEGQRPVVPEVAWRLEAPRRSVSLTPREREVMERMSTGMRNKEIAAALCISEETTHGHIKNIFLKLGVSDRTAAVTAAIRRGIIHLP
ncbi:MAG: response regulator [Vicinamibacterales bacterium]